MSKKSEDSRPQKKGRKNAATTPLQSPCNATLKKRFEKSRGIPFRRKKAAAVPQQCLHIAPLLKELWNKGRYLCEGLSRY